MKDIDAKGVIVEAKEYYDMRHELCEYHMLEQELGIGLLILAKAMMNGIYDIEESVKYDISFLRFADHFFQIEDKDGKYGKLLLYKDYGKTWALTREELQ